MSESTVLERYVEIWNGPTSADQRRRAAEVSPTTSVTTRWSVSAGGPQ